MLKVLDGLKEKIDLIASPHTFQKEKQFTLDTDGSERNVGCALLQKQKDGKDRPTGYWSRTLIEPEMKLHSLHRMCLAVVSAVLVLCPNLEGTNFIVRTDHHALRWIHYLANLASKLSR